VDETTSLVAGKVQKLQALPSNHHHMHGRMEQKFPLIFLGIDLPKKQWKQK
tara:strand:+ start:797 stop:949 length:153 start_codon:yes stop_codon:yes gene_type:complete